MYKFCRACLTGIPEDAVLCPSCGQEQVVVDATPGRSRIRKFAAFFIAVMGVASIAFAVGVVRRHSSLFHRNPHNLVRSTPKVVYQRSMVLEEETRKVYPYSIVPGGATSVDEAKVAMSRADIRANYATLDLAKLREVRLATNLTGYVSYRYGDKIYWTAKKLTLLAGETVFTDGTQIVRGRCLNCYSAYPMLPTRPNEPTEKVLDTPVDIPIFAYKFPLLPLEAPGLPPLPVELTPTVPILPVVTPIKPGGGFWFPIIPIIPPIHRHPSSPTTPGSPGAPVIPPGVPPVAVVPEPSYVWFLGAGFIALIVARSRRRGFRTCPAKSSSPAGPAS